jgi:chemosensory pili system protein ChpA (sensor histidine kinase/response regulator)
LAEEEPTSESPSEGLFEAEYDEELLEIFLEEAEELMDSSDNAMTQLKVEPGNKDLLKQLLRDLHTMKGGARMAGITPIGDLTHNLETQLEQLTERDEIPAPQFFELLQQAHDKVSDMLDKLKAGQPIHHVHHLIAQAEAVARGENFDEAESGTTTEDITLTAEAETAEEPVETTVTESESVAGLSDELKPSPESETESEEGEAIFDGDYDEELLEIFLEEAQELMDSSDTALTRLETESGDTELLKHLLRDLHTIKGGARMAGITPIGDLTHSLETQLEHMTEREETPAPQFFELLHHAHDTVSDMLDNLRDGKPISRVDKLIAQAEAIARGESVDFGTQPSAGEKVQIDFDGEERREHAVSVAMQEPEKLVVADTAESSAFEQAIQGTEPQQLTPANLESAKSGEAKGAKGERVRVDSNLLDELVNYAGEVSIYRSRLNQGSNEYQKSLDEMTTTIIRLREQLRRFEMETEAQIQSRRDQAESLGYERYEEFDPLEFDRFSNMQQITRAMAETIADLDSIENSMINLNSEAETLLIQQGRVNTDLQEGLMRTRMIPVKSQLPRFRRIVRQTAKELNKEVNFELYGGEEEIDRRVLDKIMAPMEHMLRNAVAHGVESVEQREKAGKHGAGTLKLVIGRDGSEIQIKVIDDGGGINIAGVRKKAIELGMMVPEANLSDRDVVQFILEAGFTTAKQVDQISGRGVGLDVVNSEIKQLNGTLEIESELGKGTVFDIHMPLTMSVSRALMVQVGEEIFAIPLVGIENIIRETNDVLNKLTTTENAYYQWHNEQYQFMHLGTALGINQPVLPGEKNKAPILLARSGEHRVALFVDGLMGSREIVVKSVGAQLSKVKGVTGATILGDGKVALILDLAVLAREGAAMQSAVELTLEAEAVKPKATKVITVMVVDDSITVRKVTQRLLKRYDYEVITAKDGVDAVAQLHETVPDVMLLDVEMPRMDGYELATHMRDDENFKNVPIIMITSRTGEKHRERAMKIGVNEYMGKPFQEHDLIANIKKLTET